MSKRTDRVEAAKARPLEVTKAMRTKEREIPIRKVKLNGLDAVIINKKLVFKI